MNDFVGVEVAEANQNLGSDELYLLLVESTDIAEVIKDVATLDVVKNKVNSEVILEHVFHIDDKWVFCLGKNVLLRSCVQNLSFLNQDILVDSLEGIGLVILSVKDQEDLTKRSLVNELLDSKVLKFDRLSLRCFSYNHHRISLLHRTLFVLELFLADFESKTLGDLASFNKDKLIVPVKIVNISFVGLRSIFLLFSGVIQEEIAVWNPIDPSYQVFL